MKPFIVDLNLEEDLIEHLKPKTSKQSYGRLFLKMLVGVLLVVAILQLQTVDPTSVRRNLSERFGLGDENAVLQVIDVTKILEDIEAQRPELTVWKFRVCDWKLLLDENSDTSGVILIDDESDDEDGEDCDHKSHTCTIKRKFLGKFLEGRLCDEELSHVDLTVDKHGLSGEIEGIERFSIAPKDETHSEIRHLPVQAIAVDFDEDDEDDEKSSVPRDNKDAFITQVVDAARDHLTNKHETGDRRNLAVFDFGGIEFKVGFIMSKAFKDKLGGKSAALNYMGKMISKLDTTFKIALNVRFTFQFLEFDNLNLDSSTTQDTKVELLSKFNQFYSNAHFESKYQQKVHIRLYMTYKNIGGVAKYGGIYKRHSGKNCGIIGGLSENGYMPYESISTMIHEVGHLLGTGHNYWCGWKNNNQCPLKTYGPVMSYCHMCPGGHRKQTFEDETKQKMMNYYNNNHANLQALGSKSWPL